MKKHAITLLTLLFCLLPAEGQRQRTKAPLETGYERKLGLTYKTVGQRKLMLDLYFPETGAKRPCPVIVYTHGGGWSAGSRFNAARGSFAPLFKALTREGFCIASVDYRLCRKVGSVRMRDCVIDSKDAVRYLVKNAAMLGLDPDQVLVFGDSAGGQIAQMLLLSPSDSLTGDPDLAKVDYRIVAGVSWYGPCDFENQNLFNHDDRPDFKDRFGPRIIGTAEVTPKERRQLYREMSPVNYLKRDSPPLFLIQGDQDTTIPVKHARHMEKRAQERQAPVKVLIVKNSGHNWRTVGAAIEPAREEIIEATIKFFRGHAKKSDENAHDEN